MNKKSIYNLFFLAAAGFLIAWIIVTVQQLHNWGGWLLFLFFCMSCHCHQGQSGIKRPFFYCHHFCYRQPCIISSRLFPKLGRSRFKRVDYSADSTHHVWYGHGDEPERFWSSFQIAKGCGHWRSKSLHDNAFAGIYAGQCNQFSS